MADQKVTALTNLAVGALEDLLYTVDDPAGTPTSKKITAAALLTLQAAQIYTTGGSGSQQPGTNYAKLTQFDTNGVASAEITADASNNKITLSSSGMYLVLFQASFQGTTNSLCSFRIYWNGTGQSQGTLVRKLGTGTDTGSGSMIALVDATAAGADLEVWAKCDNGSDVINIKEVQLIAVRVGNT